MRVIISPLVHEVIDEFYDYALMHHEAYDEISAIKKKDRLYNAMISLGRYARILSFLRLSFAGRLEIQPRHNTEICSPQNK